MFRCSMPPRSRSNSIDDDKPCFHCFKCDHPRQTRCTNHGIITCTKCFRLNVFTNKCNCKSPKRRSPAQVLRIVGTTRLQKWYIDLELHDQNIPARINPCINRSRVNHQLANWWQSKRDESVYRDTNSLTLKTIRKGVSINIICDVVESDELIELGMDFMITTGYSFAIEGITINSEHSPILSSPFEKEYVYNLPTRGKDLRTYLQKRKFFLKKGRVVKSCLTSSNLTVTIRRRSQSSRRSSD